MAIDLRYWDSGCFLAILKAEAQASFCDGVIEAAEDGRVRIVTSTWTLTEVIHLNSGRDLASSDDELIRGFFAQPFIVLRPVTESIAHQARKLVWERRYSRKDAIHVATAVDAGCAVLDTFDGRLEEAGGPTGLRITKPDLPATATLPFED